MIQAKSVAWATPTKSPLLGGMGKRTRLPVALLVYFLSSILYPLCLPGCGAGEASPEKEFFTSGNREADQRAEQRIAKSQQLRGKSIKDSDTAAATKKDLFTRLGTCMDNALDHLTIGQLVHDLYGERAIENP